MEADYSFFLHIIRSAVAELPECSEKPCHGTPGFYAGKKLFARLQEDGETLSVYTREKQQWMEKDPAVYFTNDHFRNYDYVLVKLPRVDPDELRILLVAGWKQRVGKKALNAYERRD
ncbi:MmcQ/YjbR family DNA-binding protein [Parapedobacter koreensis]|uniref:YjbR protein n=1 Tax=Parapedobacter koreensis TaxID=332977 RepID=A0A1H7QZX5_9SPHI|nr:hypothetical protein [Parapedobacter koreensis]SEL53581.1 hypothetical protein SAMN05421740_106200 [Parapedobacter koreensis]